MSAKKTDISQIRKYLNGELDARAMHKLEREAQDDPFLMDALEGYAGQTHDQQFHLNDLQHRLNRRINEGDKKRIALWPLISIAATILVVISVGVFWILVYHPIGQKNNLPVTDKVADVHLTPFKVQKPTARVDPPLPPSSKSVLKQAEPNAIAMSIPPAPIPAEGNAEMRIDEPVGKSDVKQVIEDTVVHSKQVAMAALSGVKKIPADSNHSLNEVVVVGYAAQLKKDIKGSVATIVPSTTNTQLQSRVEGVQVTTPTVKDRMYTQLITGRVISSDDQKPLPGVTVSVMGTKKGVLTDANGLFKMQVSKNDNLKLGYLGYESKQVKATGDSLNISLNPSQQALSEVVVTGYGSIKEAIEEAHPINGWNSFRKYLDDAVSPDSKTGKVRIRFAVNADNTLSDFKVTKSLSPGADAEAIRLIKDGPRWIHNINGEPETVTVVVKFK